MTYTAYKGSKSFNIISFRKIAYYHYDLYLTVHYCSVYHNNRLQVNVTPRYKIYLVQRLQLPHLWSPTFWPLHQLQTLWSPDNTHDIYRSFSCHIINICMKMGENEDLITPISLSFMVLFLALSHLPHASCRRPGFRVSRRQPGSARCVLQPV